MTAVKWDHDPRKRRRIGVLHQLPYSTKDHYKYIGLLEIILRFGLRLLIPWHLKSHALQRVIEHLALDFRDLNLERAWLAGGVRGSERPSSPRRSCNTCEPPLSC